MATNTAIRIITRAMRLIGVAGSDVTLSPDEVSDGLESLNAMLGSWANERLMIHVPSLDTVALTPGKQSYTIGSGAEINTVRPTSIDSMSYVRLGNVSYPLDVLTAQEYNSIQFKGMDSTIPCAIWYLQTYPSGQITLYGIPSEGMTLYLWSRKPFAEFQNGTQEVALPPGYAEAIAYNLAVLIAPEYEREASATVKARAVMSKKLLKRTNFEPINLSFPSEVMPSGRFSVYSGQ